jgi:serine/threonine protein kinase
LVVSTRGSQYETFEELGRGSFAIVYRCRSKAGAEDFAVKCIDLRPLRYGTRLGFE